MNIGNFVKTLRLNIKGDSLGRGKLKYKLTYNDFIAKLFHKNKKFNISCIMCGFPRSGSHWIRSVIESSSGLYCPSLHEIDYSMIKQKQIIPLFKIHARSKFVVKLKMFFLLPPHDFKNKYIYVYRDPRDAIISLFNMYNILMNKNLSQEQFLKNYDPIGQYKWELNAWVINKTNKNTLVVRFEDLKLNSKENFNEIFKFLNLNIELNDKSLDEFVGVVESNNRPKGQIYGWKKSYKDYKTLIDQINKELKKEINLLTYPIN